MYNSGTNSSFFLKTLNFIFPIFSSNNNKNKIDVNYQIVFHFINLKDKSTSPNNFTKVRFKFFVKIYKKSL